MNLNVNSLLMGLLFWCFLISFIFLGAFLFTKGLYDLVNEGPEIEFVALVMSGFYLLMMTAYVGRLHFKGQEQKKLSKKEERNPD